MGMNEFQCKKVREVVGELDRWLMSRRNNKTRKLNSFKLPFLENETSGKPGFSQAWHNSGQSESDHIEIQHQK